MTTRATRATGINTAPTLIAVQKTYREYVAFHSDHEDAEAGTLALWTLHTYVFDVADVTPYILVTAPTSEAGKSRIFDVAQCLVREPMPVVDPSPASIYRAIAARQPTLIIDEMDMLATSKTLKTILNAGISPGTPISRSRKVGDEWVVDEYDVFCPKAFCGIAHDKPPVTGATLSRCIQIPMRRRTAGEPIRKFKRQQARQDTMVLRVVLAEWAKVARDYLADADPPLPDGLSDRQEDSWTPLLAIAQLAGDEWLADAQRWAVELTRAIPKPPDEAVQLLTDVFRYLDGYAGGRIATSKLAEGINGLPAREYEGPPLTANQLGRRLAGFGIHHDHSPFREGGRAGQSMRGYTFRANGRYLPAWADAFERYGLSHVSHTSHTWYPSHALAA